VETCSVPQSSFQLDLTQMAVILRKSTAKTLVLIDEFGKGKCSMNKFSFNFEIFLSFAL
jgi:DNA mismatch repair ATPase MutS